MEKDDRELFKGTAWYYSRFRIDYPEELFKKLKDLFHLDGTGRLLDLGCGTGKVAMPFSRFFKEVIAIDPDKEMLQEAEKVAQKAGFTNIKWLEARAEEINPDLGNFDLTTFGASFHWMDRKLVANKVFNMTNKGGGISIIWNNSPLPGNKSTEWRVEQQKLVEKYLGEKRRAGKGFYTKGEDKFEDVIEEAGFKDVKTLNIKNKVASSIDELIGRLYSTSYASKVVLEDKVEDFEKEFRSTLISINPSGIFEEEVETQAIIAWKR